MEAMTIRSLLERLGLRRSAEAPIAEIGPDDLVLSADEHLERYVKPLEAQLGAESTDQ